MRLKKIHQFYLLYQIILFTILQIGDLELDIAQRSELLTDPLVTIDLVPIGCFECAVAYSLPLLI